jgi:hypothetical protein
MWYWYLGIEHKIGTVQKLLEIFSTHKLLAQKVHEH